MQISGSTVLIQTCVSPSMLPMLLFFLLSIFGHVSGGAPAVYGVKYMNLTSEDCVLIIGRDLKKFERVYRQERVSVPCGVGQLHFNVMKNSGSSRELFICYFDSNTNFVCFIPPDFSTEVVDMDMSPCKFDAGVDLTVHMRQRDYFYINSTSTTCVCAKNVCSRRTLLPDSCPVYDAVANYPVMNEYCSYYESAVDNLFITKFAPGYHFKSPDLDVYSLPMYDYVFQSSVDILKPTTMFIKLNFVKIGGKCSMAATYAFDKYPFYTFDIFQDVDDKLNPVCFDNVHKVAFGCAETSRFYGCVLEKSLKVQCGRVSESKFVLYPHEQVDLSVCNFPDDSFIMAVERISDKLVLKFCSTSNSSGLCCNFFRLVTGNTTFIPAKDDPAMNIYRIVDNKTYYYANSSFHSGHPLNFAGWDGLYVIEEKKSIDFDRLYTFVYREVDDNCFVEYRTAAADVLTKVITPCIPHSAPRLFYLEDFGKYVSLVVCHYDKPENAIICHDHFQNFTYTYGLNKCPVYDKDRVWLYFERQVIGIAGKHSACAVSFKCGNVYCVNPVPYNTSYVYVGISFLKRENVSHFGWWNFQFLMAAYGNIYTTATQFDAGNMTLLAADVDFAFKLANTDKFLYVPDPNWFALVPKPVVCHSIFGWKLNMLVIIIDSVLLFVWWLLFCLEIKGYRNKVFCEVKNNLINQKLDAMEAIGRVLL